MPCSVCGNHVPFFSESSALIAIASISKADLSLLLQIRLKSALFSLHQNAPQHFMMTLNSASS